MGCNSCAGAKDTKNLRYVVPAKRCFNYKEFPLWKKVLDYLDIPSLCAAGSSCQYKSPPWLE